MKAKPEMIGAMPNVHGGMKRKKPKREPSVAAANRAATTFLAKRGIAPGWNRELWADRGKAP